MVRESSRGLVRALVRVRGRALNRPQVSGKPNERMRRDTFQALENAKGLRGDHPGLVGLNGRLRIAIYYLSATIEHSQRDCNLFGYKWLRSAYCSAASDLGIRVDDGDGERLLLDIGRGIHEACLNVVVTYMFE